MKKVEAIIRPERLDAVKESLAVEGFVGLNVSNVVGRGVQRGITHVGRTGERHTVDMLPKVKLELVVRDGDVERVVNVIIAAGRTGNIGDGKIFVIPIAEAIRVRTGERGEAVL